MLLFLSLLSGIKTKNLEPIRYYFVINDSWDREPAKNSWRSLDRGGNGYLGVYEGGAGRVAQDTREVQTKEHSEEERRGADSVETAYSKRMREMPPLPFEKRAVGRSEAVALKGFMLSFSLC